MVAANLRDALAQQIGEPHHAELGAPARLFGLRDRGRVATGMHADLVLFDPNTIGSAEIHERADLPGGTSRLFAESKGVLRVFVAGQTIVRDGKATDARPGQLIKSGRDTATVSLAGR